MAARRSDKRRTGGPPELRFHLARKLKLVLLANTIPLLILVWMAWAYSRGDIDFRSVGSEGLGTILLVSLFGCVVIGIGAWVVMPVGRWLRDYPLWYWRNSDVPLLWALPCLVGWAAWFGLWVVVGGASIGVLWIIGTGIWRLIE